MEGPSLYLAKKQLRPFRGKRVLRVSGNSKIGIERLEGKYVLDIYAWGKHLVFQFDEFAMRTHFLLFGTFEATVEGNSVTGDYRKAKIPRLQLEFQNGLVSMYNCSIKFIETSNLKNTYEFSIDIMSPKWDTTKAFDNLKVSQNKEIADVLLDQTIFAGVGNIIKNEVLSIVKLNPSTLVQSISDNKINELIDETHKFSHQFLKWREKFKLKQNLKIYRKSNCPHCGGKVTRKWTGKTNRLSHWCPVCQPEKEKFFI